MGRAGRILAAGTLIALICGCGASTTVNSGVNSGVSSGAEPEIDSTTVVVHEFSGMRFPLEIEGFERGDVRTYDDSGYNTSVGYIDERGVIVTVYVYPIPYEYRSYPDALLAEFEGATSAIEVYFDRLEVVEQAEVIRVQQGVATNGFYQHASGFLQQDGTRRRVFTTLFLYRFESWFIKYRATYDYSLGEPGRRAVERLIDALVWPDRAPDPVIPASPNDV